MEFDDKGKWICELCNREFTTHRYLWAHQNRTKTPCISKEKCQELVQQVQSTKSKINYFKEQAEQSNQELIRKNQEYERQKKELEHLKTLLLQVEDMKDTFSDKLDQVQQTVEKKNNTFSCTQNLLINNLNQQNKNNIINIEFSKPREERLDHITQDMMMNILNQKNYKTSVGKLMQSIYFHPEAPQNWNWCVTNRDIQFGVLQFDHETGNLHRENTEQVIQKRYSNVMFRVVDILDELRQSRNMNKPQSINCSRLCNSLGTPLDPDQVSTVKEVAYQGRNLSKSLWDYIGVAVETTSIPTRITIKDTSK